MGFNNLVDFRQGDRVLVNGRGPNDHSQRGRVGTFLEYVHMGYGDMARISLDPKPEWRDKSEDRWMLHPESLTLIRSIAETKHPNDPPISWNCYEVKQ